jgi:hypothetical protein
VPFLIYAAALTGTLVALKKNKLTDNGADWLVSLMMFTVLAVPAFEHYNSIILVLMPTIASTGTIFLWILRYIIPMRMKFAGC